MGDDRREIELALRQGLLTQERLAALGGQPSLDRLVEEGALGAEEAQRLRTLAAMAASDTLAGPAEGEPPPVRTDADTVALQAAPVEAATQALPPGHRPLGAVRIDDPEDPPQLTGFRTGRLLGRGGTGAVWDAVDLSTGSPVALKVLHRVLSSVPDIRARFLREARAALELDHPCIVRVRAAGEEDGSCYIAFDRVAGRPLSELTDRQPLPADRAARWARDLADALAHAHAHRVLHRDVKPANVFVTAEWKVLLLDFGLARPQDASRLTGTGEVLGTPGYMSPEQILSAPTDRRTDVYGLGATLYAMLHARAPYPHVSVLLHRDELFRGNAPEVDPSVPAGLAAIVRMCLSTEKEGRYASAEDLRDDLDRFLDGRPTVAEGVHASRRRWRAAGWVVAAAACVAGGMLLARELQGGRPSAAAAPQAAGQGTRVELRGSGVARLFAFDDRGAADRADARWAGTLPATVTLPDGSWLLDASCRVPFVTPATREVEVPAIQPPDGYVVVVAPGRRPFLLGRCPVTSAEYAAWLKALPSEEQHARAPRERDRRHGWREFDIPAKEPVRGVSWDDARAYAAAQGARLPTREEWGVACRGADGRPYPWGRGLDPQRARQHSHGAARTYDPVGAWPKGEAPCGAMDLFGSVGEWVEGGAGRERYARGARETEDPERWCDSEIEAVPGGEPRNTIGVRLARDP